MGAFGFPSLGSLDLSQIGQSVSNLPILVGGEPATFTGNLGDLPAGATDTNGLPIPLASARPSTPAGTPAAPSSWSNALNAIEAGLAGSGVLGSIPGIAGGANSTTQAGGTNRGLSDYVGIVAGLGFVVVGLLMFKPVSNVIVQGAGHVRRAGETVATVAA